MVQIIPAILSDSLIEVEQQLEWATIVDSISRVQVDIIDGWFADNMTVTPSDLRDLSFGSVMIDWHLMTEDPLDYVFEILEDQQKLPSNLILGHIEKMYSPLTFIDQVRQTNIKVGLALDLFTPIDSIELDWYSQLDAVQLMGIEAGFQGQAFVQSVVDKLEELLRIRAKHSLSFEILIDGGIKKPQLEQLSKLGIDGAVVGSGLWRSEDWTQTLEEYQSLAVTSSAPAK